MQSGLAVQPTRRPNYRQLAEQNVANSPNKIDIPLNDAVVHLRNGAFGLVEIKLGGTPLIEKGARTLTALSAKLDPAKLPAPSFLMVLVADGDIAYRRPDGITVCPLSALKP